MSVETRLVDNPRKEAASNDLDVCNATLLSLGLQPITLSEGLLREISEIARVYADRCEWNKIPATAQWTSPRQIATDFAEEDHVRIRAELRADAILQAH